MQSISLKHTTIFDRLLNLYSQAPALGNALPALAINKMNRVYEGFLAELTEVQRTIHTVTREDALAEKKRYEKTLKWLSPFESVQGTVQSKVKPLYSTILQVVRKLRENVFLMDLVINHELEAGDKLADLLEDYYDGLLIQQRKGEESIPWEQVKARLNAKHYGA